MRRGTQKEAIDYVKKGEQTKKESKQLKKQGKCVTEGPNYGKNLKGFYEEGTPTTVVQGQHAEFTALYEAVKQGKTNLELCDEFSFQTYNRCYKAVDRLRIDIEPEWDINKGREVILLQGPGRSGKTKWAYTNYPGLYKVSIIIY